MRSELTKKKVGLFSVVLVSSGLLAWSLVALFQADNARLEGETFLDQVEEDESLDEPIPPEDLGPETKEPSSPPQSEGVSQAKQAEAAPKAKTATK